MRHLTLVVLFIGFIQIIPDSLFSKDQTVHILFTESTNGFLQNCECPVQPFGGMARRKTLIDSMRTIHENLILLDAGNFLSTFNRHQNDSLMIELMHQFNYNAVNFGQNENRFFKQKKGIPFTFTSLKSAEQNTAICRKKSTIIQMVSRKIKIIGIYHPSQLNQLDQEILIKQNEADFVIVLSKLTETENKKLIEQYKGHIHCIIGNHSEDSLTGKWIQYKQTHLFKAGVDGQSVGHIQLLLNNKPEIKNVHFYKVKKWILPDQEFMKQINHLEATH